MAVTLENLLVALLRMMVPVIGPSYTAAACLLLKALSYERRIERGRWLVSKMTPVDRSVSETLQSPQALCCQRLELVQPLGGSCGLPQSWFVLVGGHVETRR